MKSLINIIFSLALLIACFTGLNANARMAKPHIAAIQNSIQLMTLSNLPWKIGDTLNFKLTMSPIPLKGTMKMYVNMEALEGFILIQDVDMSLLGKQHIEALIDKDTGKTLRMTVNGEPQTVPDQSEAKVLKMEEAKVTVPAGTFDAIHVVTEDANKKQAEMWINPALIPINGMLKSIQVQIKPLKMTMELVSFKHGK